MATVQPVVSHSVFGSRWLSAAGVLSLLLTVSLMFTGASGLMYQVVWFRVLGLIFGVTVHATSAVLAAFMAGLAIGSVLAAKVADRVKNPLLLYGVAEILIGVFGLSSLGMFALLQPLYRWAAVALTDNEIVLAGLRFGLACVIMLPPTILMGATLPLVVRSVVMRHGTLARSVSLLYAANTFGAIVGAFGSGFYLIGIWGTVTTALVAAVFNVVVGAVWLVAALGPFRVATIEDAPGYSNAVEHDAPVANFRVSPRVATAVLVAYGVSGFISLAYEVVWTRILMGIVPGTTYAFTLMLCAILTGIAVGSWAVNPVVSRRWNWTRIFVGLEIAIGALALYSLLMLSQTYRIEGLLRSVIAPGGGELLLVKPWFMVFMAAIGIVPVAFIMGVLFPIATMIYAAGRREVGASVGAMYGANVLGAITGSLVAGLVMIPLIGAQNTLWVLALGNIVAGIGVLWVAPVSQRARLTVTVGVVAALVVARVAMPNVYSILSDTDPRGERAIWYHEGQEATVMVVANQDGKRSLRINSMGQGTDRGPVLTFHYQLGHYGPLLHPNPNDALIVGLGVGATAGATAIHPDISMTIIELIPGVLDAAHLFSHVNYDVLRLPNVTTHVTDGRNYLLLTDKKYDIIESDPILPTTAGAANLYSRDYYMLARDALKPGGIMVQWIDPSLHHYSYRMMIRTFLEVFPHATLWHDGSILIGSTTPLVVDARLINAKFNDPRLASAWRDAAMSSSDDVLRGFVGGPDVLRYYVGEGRIMTDQNPYIEYFRSLPNDGPIPDLRWLQAVAYIGQNARAGDRIVFSDPTFKERMTKLPLPVLVDLVLPSPTSGANDAALPSNVLAFVNQPGRTWVIPSPIRDRDAELLRALGTPSDDFQGGLVRVVRYDR